MLKGNPRSLSLVCRLAVLSTVALISAATSRADVHYLESSDLPITLGYEYQGDTVRISGSRITTAGNGVFVDADNIYFDFENDTLEFGTSYGDDLFGVRIGSSSLNGVVIKGGTILHGGGVNGSQRSESCACLSLRGTSGILVDGTNMIIRGIDGRCVGTTNYQSNRNVEIKGGRYRSEGIGYYSREMFNGSTFKLESPSSNLGPGEFNWKIHDLVIENTIHSGVKCGGLAYIYRCTVIVDARNDLYSYPSDNFSQGSANSGGFAINDLEAGSTIHDNVILADSNYSGFDVGILMEMAGGTAENPILIYNNYVEGHRGRDAHYGDLNCKGMKWRGKNKHVKIYNNVFRVKADGDPSTPYRGPGAHAMEVLCVRIDGQIDSFITIENNYFEAYDVDGNSEEASSTRLEVQTGGTATWTGAGNVWRNNRLKSNRTVYNMANQYDHGCGNFLSSGDTVESYSAVHDFATYRLGRWDSYCTGNVFGDAVYFGYCRYDDVHFYPTDRNSDVRIQRTLVVTARGNNGLPVPGATVTVENNYGNTVLSGTTNAYGKLSGPVTYLFETYSGSDSANFNPFSITVRKGSDNASVDYTITPSSSLPTLTLSQTAGEDPPPEVNHPPTAPTHSWPQNSDTIVQSGPVELTVDNAHDIDGDVLHYRFWLSSEQSFASILDSVADVPETPGQTSAAFSSSLFELGRTYWWRCQACDDSASSPLTTPTSFVYAFFGAGEDCDQPIDPPALSAPANGTGISGCLPTLCVRNSPPMADCSQPYRYLFQIFSDPQLNELVAADTVEENDSTACYLCPQTLGCGRYYWWRARCTNGIVASNWAGPFSFHTENTPPTAPTPLWPEQDDTVNTRKPTLIAMPSEDPDEAGELAYQFQISKFEDFRTADTSRWLAEIEAAVTWRSRANLENHSMYFWRLRAHDGLDYSNFSITRSFLVGITANSPPSTPILHSPDSGAEISVSTPTLRIYNAIDPDGDLLTYTFELYYDNEGPLVASIQELTEGHDLTSWSVPEPLNDATAYRWRARCTDGADSSDWSGWRPFTVMLPSEDNDPPSQPVHFRPAAGSTIPYDNVSLVIENSFDPDGDSLYYDFWVYADSNLTQLAEACPNVAEQPARTAVQLTFTPINGQKYWWRVRAGDGINTTTPTTPTWFIYSSTASGDEDYVALAAYPPNGTVVYARQPVLKAANIATGGEHNLYYFDVSTDSSFVNPTSSSPPVPEGEGDYTPWTVTEDLEAGRTYYWRVRANNYPYSPASSFSVGSKVFASPNPVHFRKGEQVTFHLPDEPVDLLIQTVSGETVRLETNLSERWVWDGTNASGHPVAVGIYPWFVRGVKVSGKIVVKP